MPWSDQLVDRLRRLRSDWILVVQTSDIFTPNGKGEWSYSTAPTQAGATPSLADTAAPLISLEGTSLGGALGRLDVQSWTVTHGSWVVSLALGPENWTELAARISRGQLVELRLGWPGLGACDYERVAMGVVRSIVWDGQSWSITFDDAAMFFQSRGWAAQSSGATSSADLFADVNETTVTTKYHAGDTSIAVSSTTGLEKKFGGNYLIAIIADTGELFYLTGTGLTATSVTGLSATGYGGSTADTADVGNAVYLCAYDDGSPFDLARRLLQAKGGSIGFNVWPSTWGFGLPADVIDADDIDWHSNRVTPISGSTWSMIVTEPQSNGMTWADSFFSVGGLFLTMRQGLYTVRCGFDPDAHLTPGLDPIDDDDIQLVRTYEPFAADYPVEYEALNIRGGIGASYVAVNWADGVNYADTLPAEQAFSIEATPILTNVTNQLNEIGDRLGPYYSRVPQVIEIECAGLYRAVHCVGDVVDLTISKLRGRELSEQEGITNRRAVVVSVSPDWLGGRVTLRLLLRPTVNTEIP
jgi:hypothetical protein